MVPRSPHEHPRTATSLELFFDLVFVVAIAFAGAQLHHALSANHAAQGVLSFVLVFFAIWWAWMGFTWFASAFDVDDVPYRIAVWVQMAGALVIAAGVAAAFEKGNFTSITLGYVLMRIASVAQWLRASAQCDGYGQTCRRYAVGISLVQLGWVANLATPQPWALTAFLLLAVCEIAVPMWAEKAKKTPWHPHHIAERYGLFTIIVLGESVLAAVLGVQTASAHANWSQDLLLFCAGAFLVVFCMWWLYFEDSVAERLEGLRTAYVWGYGHFVVFAAAAATGAGLAVQVDVLMGEAKVSAPVGAASLAVPVALYVLAVWFVHKCNAARPAGGRWVLPVAALVIFGTPWVPFDTALTTGIILVVTLATSMTLRRN
jgi:low temperature requirement protein LtrA